MNKVGYAKFQYKIPYDDQWYIILTSKQYHFYYNFKEQVSYWQLSDIFQNFSDIDKNEFIKSIDFNQVAILIAKNNGLKGIDDYYLKNMEKSDQNLKSNQVVTGKLETDKKIIIENPQVAEKVEESFESDEPIDDTIDLDHGESNNIIKQLLQEEGLLKDNLKETPGLITGYSSSEDETEDEDVVQDGDVEDDESKNDENLEYHFDDSSNKNADFLALLDKLESKISIYEPWNLIEEELIQELVTFPEYYSVDNPHEREQLFNDWCLAKSKNQSNVEETTLEEEIEVAKKFPTKKLNYLIFLQKYKPEVKKLYYEQFLNKYYLEMLKIELNSNDKQTIYITFRTFLTDFSIEEKQMKKSHKYDSNVNLKKLKLQTYLKSQQFSGLSKQDYLQVLNEIKQNPKDFMENWLFLINMMNFRESLVDDVHNFIVGDEKRLNCYLEVLESYFNNS